MYLNRLSLDVNHDHLVYIMLFDKQIANPNFLGTFYFNRNDFYNFSVNINWP